MRDPDLLRNRTIFPPRMGCRIAAQKHSVQDTKGKHMPFASEWIAAAEGEELEAGRRGPTRGYINSPIPPKARMP